MNVFEVIGIRPLAPVQNGVSLKLTQHKTLNFMIKPDVENLTKWLDFILTKVSIIKRFYTLEFILSVHIANLQYFEYCKIARKLKEPVLRIFKAL